MAKVEEKQSEEVASFISLIITTATIIILIKSPSPRM